MIQKRYVKSVHIMTFVLFKGRMHMKKSLYIYNCGDLKRKDNTLRFTTYDDEKRDVPIERISDIYVMSELSFNTKFINFISQYGIPMHFFNYYHFYTGSYYPRESLLSGELLVKQVEHYIDKEKESLLRENLLKRQQKIFIEI